MGVRLAESPHSRASLRCHAVALTLFRTLGGKGRPRHFYEDLGCTGLFGEQYGLWDLKEYENMLKSRRMYEVMMTRTRYEVLAVRMQTQNMRRTEKGRDHSYTIGSSVIFEKMEEIKRYKPFT